MHRARRRSIARGAAALRPQSGVAAFTLLEMLVTMVLMAIGLTGAMSAVSENLRAARAASEYNTAALLAQSRLAELEYVDGALTTQGTDEGDFGEQYPGWRWEQDVEPAESDGLLQVTVTVYWGPENHEKSYTLVTYRLQPPETDTTGGTNTTGGASASTSSVGGAR